MQISVWDFIYPSTEGQECIFSVFDLSSLAQITALAGTQYLSMERVDYFAILVFVPNLMKVHFEFPTP